MEAIAVLGKHEILSWNAFVNENEAGTIYHHDDWMRVINKTYGSYGQYVVVKDESGKITAGLPIFFVKNVLQNKISTVPCAQCCNPIVTTKEQFIKLLEALNGIAAIKKNSFYEIKTNQNFNFHNFKDFTPQFCTFELSLEEDLDSLKSKFHKNCIRRPINKTETNGLQIKVVKTEQGIRDFYNLYLRMRKENGLLPQPFKFFLNLWLTFSERQQIEVIHAEHQKKIIASILLLKFKKTVIYEYGAIDRNMTHLHPSHFLLWNAIKASQQGGYKIFDFGRTSIDNAGLMNFKERWGAKKVYLFYYYLPEIERGNRIRDIGIAKKIMENVISFSPTFLCEKLGTFVYKFLI
ncbi:MAG TPA: GNAT family N-acetyltransferase [Negativicutes bacterium]|jgi:hypothetical protein